MEEGRRQPGFGVRCSVFGVRYWGFGPNTEHRTPNRTPNARRPTTALGAWLLAAFCLLLPLVCRPVAAQSFGPPLRSEVLLEFFDKQGNLLFTLAAYTAYWRNPYRVNVTVVSPALLGIPGVNPNVSRRFELVGEAATSPLLEGSYVLDDRWSIGFWYNPVSDRSRQRVVQIADVVLGMELERNADLADVHVVYRTPKGLSTQIGYYYEGGRVRIRESNLQNPPTFRTQSARYRFSSWNVWVTQRLDVQIGRQLITPFLSAGYHSSSDLNRAVSILVGAGVTFSERLSFSGSVWWFDLDRAATRVTAGLEYRF